MKCGHAANATTTINKKVVPCCAICYGINDGAMEIDKTYKQPVGRKAICSYGHHAIVDSNTNLAFFKARPNEEYDRYYCGCWGWN